MRKAIMLILCGFMVLGITGCGNNKNDKLTKYLENNNFKCEKSSEEDERIKKVCTKENDVKEIFYLYEDNSVSYKVQNGSYSYTIHDSIYNQDSKMSETSIIMSNNDDLTCNYLPENGSFTYGSEFDTTSSDMTCIKYIDKINQSLRDFEKYCKDAEIELKYSRD